MSIPPMSSMDPNEMRSESQTGYTSPGSSWTGLVAFAGIVMILLGIFHIIQGLVALFNDSYYLVGKSGLVLNVDFTAWGWVQILAGLLVLAAGAGLFAGQIWARSVAVILAVVSAVVNIGFLAAYPIWSMMMIALDVLVIWALTVHGGEMRD